MASSIVTIVCSLALFAQHISGQCIGNTLAVEELGIGALRYPEISPFGFAGSPGYNLNVATTSGGSFAVTSSSPIPPTGISIFSENAIEGPLSVIGELPFLAAVALEGKLPTAGAGGINYGCGDGAVGIVSEGLAPTYGPLASSISPNRIGFGAPGISAPGFPISGVPAGVACAGYGPQF